MCHWLGMLRPALVAHTDALGAGNAVRQNGQRYEATRRSTTRLLQGYYQVTTRLLPKAARAPLGQQHSSGSTASLLALLVLAARSWRRRSAHRTEDLEEAVRHVQLKSAESGG
jgi:hypothetical protein